MLMAPHDSKTLCAAQLGLTRALAGVDGVENVWLIRRAEDDLTILLVEVEEDLAPESREQIPDEYAALPVRIRSVGGPLTRRGETFVATNHAIDEWLPRLLRDGRSSDLR